MVTAAIAPGRPPYAGGVVDNEQLLEESDACGVGFIASLKGDRTHKTVQDALTALGCSLCDPVAQLGNWAIANIGKVEAARAVYDGGQD